MTYEPLNEEQKQQWIDWLQSMKERLEKMPTNANQHAIFDTPDGDVATAQDIVCNFLATLTNKTVSI